MNQPPSARYGGYSEPTPWAAGIAVSVLVALLATAGVYAFGAALAQVHWTLAVAVNLVAAGGAAPSAWRWRTAPVIRWILLGVAVGVVLGWIALLIVALSS
ncbi:DUF2537 domain-containing protein [Nocardia macrotermitis]|uniref:DUF2537 domain-containing protein n=1 Tax=Nocardia macrotermitis TaxID=2585198 RepID=A0A7K0D0T6_9NOCA|nr:DUF2537 domain-containing protein [Nocardia macrotermitis]MQY19281.1 hypothetical protein [Nocardia macrotermitis]